MSRIDWPRTLSGLCSPSAHSTASVMLDFPDPFGPTITLTPGENTSEVRSGKDLKPLMAIALRCMDCPSVVKARGRVGRDLCGDSIAALTGCGARAPLP